MGGISRLLALLILIPFAGSAQIIITVGGNGDSGNGGDGGPATAGQIRLPGGLAFDSHGSLFIATHGETIRKIDMSSGVIFTVAGTGVTGFSGDNGPATNAKFNWPSNVVFDDSDNLYISDGGNQRVRKVNAITGIITTIAGNGTCGYTGDGDMATAASLCTPAGLAFDSKSNLYIADRSNNVVRKIDTAGRITTYAGNGELGFGGDNGPATAAKMHFPISIAIDNADNLYISDWLNNRIRKVDATTKVITTVAGNGIHTYSVDGIAATSAQLTAWAITLDRLGNLYIADGTNERIHKVINSGLFYWIGGNGIAGFSGDSGPAKLAQLYNPQGITVDSCGNVFISDDANHRVRKIDVNPHCWPVNVNAKQQEKISIYPNPTNEQLYIDGLQKEQKYTVRDVAGVIIQQGKLIEGSNIIDVSRLSAGIYLFEITSDDGRRVVRKIVKQ